VGERRRQKKRRREEENYYFVYLQQQPSWQENDGMDDRFLLEVDGLDHFGVSRG
jgi:hypothetical protein